MEIRSPKLCGQAIERVMCLVALLLCGVNLPAKEIDFNRDIRPILSSNCIACHGPDSSARQADLRLDVEKSTTAVRDGHPAIVPGKLDQSDLIRRITSNDENERMPPADSNKRLKPREIEL